jgi:hypothetical protein
MGPLGVRGYAGFGLVGLSAMVQPGLEHVPTPRFALTLALDLGVRLELRARAPDALFQGALVVGMRAG